MVEIYQYDPNQCAFAQSEDGKKSSLFEIVSAAPVTEATFVLELAHSCQAVYGMGERFNQINQKGLTVETEVIEHFCNQGKFSYCPVPFFFTEKGLGVYVDTLTVTEFSFEENIRIKMKKDSNGSFPIVYIWEGEPKEIITEYAKKTGQPALPPKWCFGPWMSANRWSNQEETLQQAEIAEKLEIPHTVLVVEAWSDESTFYRWNGDGKWENPKEMIGELEKKGIKLILWQIPVLKKMDKGEHDDQLEADWAYGIKHDLVIKNTDGTPYRIPEGHWFAGSLLPDFTKKEACDWWFSKRDHLLEAGVAGFKTDGGEFILTDDVIASNGMTGLELRNYFASSYVKAYTEYIGPERTLFSRAGYTGQQKYPMQWAGDQMSTWEEFCHAMTAGLSIGMSGVPYWGFDIGGFAGPMPTVELYERAVQAAAFAPVMQWHSEPVGGQFAELYPSSDGMNDRSPWNMGKTFGDDTLVDRMRFWFNLRMNLLPYIYQQAILSHETGLPMMKHLALEYGNDAKVYNVQDCFMLGDILVAPVVNEGAEERDVYLPEGRFTALWRMDVRKAAGPEKGVQGADEWQTIQAGESLAGGETYCVRCGRNSLPVFVRDGGCIALNLGEGMKLGSKVGNDVKNYQKLCFYPVGDAGSYYFRDDLGNDIRLTWKDGECQTERVAGTVEFEVLKELR